LTCLCFLLHHSCVNDQSLPRRVTRRACRERQLLKAMVFCNMHLKWCHLPLARDLIGEGCVRHLELDGVSLSQLVERPERVRECGSMPSDQRVRSFTGNSGPCKTRRSEPQRIVEALERQ